MSIEQNSDDRVLGAAPARLTRDVDEVLLPCTVVDQDGHLVQDLSKGDFQVFEDNTPQSIVSFAHSDVPVSIGLLVDNSGSMRDKRAAVNAAALDLVKASNPEDEAFVVNFSDEAFIDQDVRKPRAGGEVGPSLHVLGRERFMPLRIGAAAPPVPGCFARMNPACVRDAADRTCR